MRVIENMRKSQIEQGCPYFREGACLLLDADMSCVCVQSVSPTAKCQNYKGVKIMDCECKYGIVLRECPYRTGYGRCELDKKTCPRTDAFRLSEPLAKRINYED